METVTDTLKEAGRGMYIDSENYLHLDDYYECDYSRMPDLYFLRDYGVVTFNFFNDILVSVKVNPGFEKLFESED